MKNYFVLICFILISMYTSAQTKTPVTPLPKSNVTVIASENDKEHICTSSCKNGKHKYIHGEKGHKCGALCMRTMSKNKASTLKEHICTVSCINGIHVYAHGEKGHQCNASCQKAKSSGFSPPSSKS